MKIIKTNTKLTEMLELAKENINRIMRVYSIFQKVKLIMKDIKKPQLKF